MTADRPTVALGLGILTVGALLLLSQLGAVTTAAVGPMLLVAGGVGVLLFGQSARGAQELPVETAGVSLDGAQVTHLHLHYGAGTLTVGPGAGAGRLYEGTFTGGVRQELRRSGGRMDVDLHHGAHPRRWLGSVRPLDWSVALGGDAVVDLEISTGASRVRLDLAETSVRSLALHTGASDVDVVLPARGATTVTIEAGAADVALRVPPGVAASVRNRSALAGVDIDLDRFPRAADGHRSPDYDVATDRADIVLDGAAASFSVH